MVLPATIARVFEKAYEDKYEAVLFFRKLLSGDVRKRPKQHLSNLPGGADVGW